MPIAGKIAKISCNALSNFRCPGGGGCLIDRTSGLGNLAHSARRNVCLTVCLLFVYFFLHLFIVQAIYIVLQDLKMKMLFVELNIRLQE